MPRDRRQKNKRSRSLSPLDVPVPPSWLPSTANWNGIHENDVLVIEAHEADLLMSCEDIADTLEPSELEAQNSGRKGSALLKWTPDGEADITWVDRYDARLLLSSSPRELRCTSVLSVPPSPSGWSDLPSDSEDTFFFSASETSDFRHKKRRRLLDEAQSARVKSIRIRDGDEGGSDDAWGDDDEQPDSAQSGLMLRTARHILDSAEPVVLETRILANHGADRRFAFLRGRWRNAWLKAKEMAKDGIRKEAEAAEQIKSQPLGLSLADYGDSDEERVDEEQNRPEVGDEQNRNGGETESSTAKFAAQAMDARRLRAREWAAKRRAEKAALSG